jgi:tetratricopeptide (TPR) repeat protein
VAPGSRQALRALLALNDGDAATAELLHALAQEQGDHATWPAYKLGLHFLAQKRYEKAACWFRRTCIDMVDSIQAHSLCLLGLCELRLGHYEEALDVATTCISLLPMCEEGYVVASHSAARIPGKAGDAHGFQHQLELIQATQAELER